jgi:hypothetical protein
VRTAVAAASHQHTAVFAVTAVRFALAGIYELSAVTFWQSAAGLVGLLLTVAAGSACWPSSSKVSTTARSPDAATARRRRGRP